VGDRFIQLTPVYKGGAKLGDNARFGVDRTATPLELDQIYGSLNDLSVALGPDGANAKDGTGVGALTRLLESTSKNFGGQGEQFNQTINNVAGLTTTLDASKDNLFGTARELETFIHTLAKNDTTVRQFNDSLASAADLLAGERNDLASALHNLSTALVAVRGFVHDNREQLTQNITKINNLATTLVKRRGEIDEILSDAPVALNNLGLAYNPKTGTLDTRAGLTEGLNQIQADPTAALCGLVTLAKGPTDACTKALAALKLPRTAPLQTTQGLSDPGRFVDRTLGGLVEAGR
ncbi:MAG: virulence factor Mce family protein, partial [Nocardioidaceae bacterium]|nr:virulence factor Mce family protein [Nocardioidaceae bacterium]